MSHPELGLASKLRRLLHRPAPNRTTEHQKSIAPAPDIRVSAHGDGLIILHIPSGRIFTCNSIGGRIWNRVVTGVTPDAVSDEISHDFGVAPALAREHTNAFVKKLQYEGLLIHA